MFEQYHKSKLNFESDYKNKTDVQKMSKSFISDSIDRNLNFQPTTRFKNFGNKSIL